MTAQKRPQPTKAAIAAARQRAEATRRNLAHKPPPAELLTTQELADAAPFYFVLREYIRQLKEAREAAGLTLADVSAKTGMAVEYLSRLETGAQTNPTWKTLGTYAKALGRRPQLTLEVIAPPAQSVTTEPAPTTDTSSSSDSGMTAEPLEPIAKWTRKALPEIVWKELVGNGQAS
jgi:transcriptional regulator with XRE-family HTH domain